MNLVNALLDPSLQSPSFPSFPSAFDKLTKFTQDHFADFRSVEKDHLKFFVGNPNESVEQLEKDIKDGLAFLGDYGTISHSQAGKPYVQKKDLLARMIVYSSTDGAFLLERHKEIPPIEDDVMVFFIELPSGDKYSDTVFAAVAGKNAIKYIMDVYEANWDAITDPITIPTLYRELILKAIVENRQENAVISAYTIAKLGLKKIGEEASSILVPLLLDITKLEKFFSETLTFKEATWNVGHDGHLKISVVDLINAKIESYSNFLDNFSKNIPEESYLKYLKPAIDSYNIFLDGVVSVIKGIEIVSELLFAAFCGIWNSLMDLISGIISLIKMVVEIVYGITDLMANADYYKNYLLEQIDNITQAIQNIDWKEVIDSFIINVLKINDSVSDLPLSLLKKAISLNHTEVGYYTGYLLFEVVQMVFPVGLIIKGATSAAKVSKFGRLFKLEDKLSDLNRAAQNFETKKSQKSIVHAGISKTEIQAFLDFLKILSEKLAMKTKGFVDWLNEIFERLKKWLDDLFIKGKKAQLKDFESGKIKGNVDANGKKRKIGDQTRYSNYAEMKIDDYFETQTFKIGNNTGTLKRVSSKTVKTFDDKIEKGIDGIYAFSNPPPYYIISEVKYNKATLTKDITKSGGSQMSKKWVNFDLLKGAVSPEIVDDILLYGYESVLSHVTKSGTVTISAIKQTSKGATKGVAWNGKII